MIGGKVTGDRGASLIRSVRAIDDGVRRAVQALAVKLVGAVHGRLRGPRPTYLGIKSGRLFGSINHRLTNTATESTAIVGTNVKYGRVHELGGTFLVKAHVRNMTQVWGHRLPEPRQVQVRAHSKTYPKRSFLVASLKAMAPEIRERLEREVVRAVKDSAQ